MDYDAIQKAVAEKNQEIGRRYAEVPKIYEQYSPSRDPEVQGLRGAHADKVRQLFERDTELADVYFQPKGAPALPGETVPTPEPMLIDPTIGVRASSAQTRATANELADIIQQIGLRKDTLLTEREHALAGLNAIIAANQQEQSFLEKQMDWYFKNEDLKRKSAGSTTQADLQTFFDNLVNLKATGEAVKPRNIYGQNTTKQKGQSAIESMKNLLPKYREKYPDAILEYTKNPDGTYDWIIRGKDQTFLDASKNFEAYQDPEQTAQMMLTQMMTNPKTASGAINIYDMLFPEGESSRFQEEQKKEAIKDLVATVNHPDRGIMTKETFLKQAYMLYPELSKGEVDNIVNQVWFEIE